MALMKVIAPIAALSCLLATTAVVAKPTIDQSGSVVDLKANPNLLQGLGVSIDSNIAATVTTDTQSSATVNAPKSVDGTPKSNLYSVTLPNGSAGASIVVTSANNANSVCRFTIKCNRTMVTSSGDKVVCMAALLTGVTSNSNSLKCDTNSNGTLIVNDFE